jgi:hypothetical protein
LINGIMAVTIIVMASGYVAWEHFRSSVITPPGDNPPLIITNAPGFTYRAFVGMETSLLMVGIDPDGLTIDQNNVIQTSPFDVVQSIPGASIEAIDYHPAPLPEYTIPISILKWTPSAGDTGDHTMKVQPYQIIGGERMNGPVTTIRVRVQNLTNQEALQEIVDRGLTTKNTLSDLISTIRFDNALQSMTTSELLHALIGQGIITRYPSYDALAAALPSQGIDLAPLKPYGILQALATAPKGGPILRQKDIQRPWMIVQDAYDDLQAQYDADPFTLLQYYDLHHLLVRLDDGIAPASGNADPLPFYTVTKETSSTSVAPEIALSAYLQGRNYATGETEAQYRARFPAMAASIKAKLDALPPGHRAIKLAGIERLDPSVMFEGVYPPLRKSDGTLAEQQGYFPASYDCSGDPPNPNTCPDGPPSPTGCIDGSKDYKKNHCLFSLWLSNPTPEEDWYNTVRSRLSEFFREYQSIGGNVDFIITDMESDWFSMYFARRIWFLNHEDVITSDPRWAGLSQEFQDAGITSYSDLKNWFAHNDWRGLLWDSVMAHRLSASYNNAMMQPIQMDIDHNNAPLFPNIRFTDYEFYYRSNLSPAGDYRDFPKNIASIGDIVGTHPSLDVYARTWEFTMPAGLTTDVPTQPVTFFENLLFDLKKARTLPLSSTLHGMVWMAHPYYTRYDTTAGDIDPLFETAPLNDIDDWYIERMFHHGLVGIDAFLNWTASTLDTAIKNAHSGSLAEYDRGFATMQQGLDELNGLIGFSDRSPLTMRQIDFQDGFALSGLEVHGTRVYRFTPNPEVPHEVRTVGDGIELYSNGTLVKKIPHSTSIQNHKGYWIIQTGTDSLFTHGIDEMLQLL